MKPLFTKLEPAIPSFIAALQQHLADPRDPRGRRHSLVFVLAATAVALVCGCQTVSAIQRFIRYRHRWLVRVLNIPERRVVSRAQLPRILDRTDWGRLNALITAHFGAVLPTGWVAIDGKTLCGSSPAGERQAVVFAVCHTTCQEVARAEQAGMKCSEIPITRQFLHDSGLERCKVTLDALHCNPGSLRQINQAGGVFLTQVKGNQPELAAACKRKARQPQSLAEWSEQDKGHGRLTCWTTWLYRLWPRCLHPRWAATGLRYLVAVRRETTHSSGKVTDEVSYYVTNDATQASRLPHLQQLSTAIRRHWSVETNNWVRDVTLGEDQVRILAPNQGQVLAALRSVALAVLRSTGPTNLQALIEKAAMVPRALAELLRRAAFT